VLLQEAVLSAKQDYRWH